MNAPPKKPRVLRLHPLGVACLTNDPRARYFEMRIVSTEYWRRAQRGCPASKEEVAAFARSALVEAIQRGKLPEHALDTDVQVVEPPLWDRTCLDYRVYFDHAHGELRPDIKAAIEAGLVRFNGRWDAEDSRSAGPCTAVAFRVCERSWR